MANSKGRIASIADEAAGFAKRAIGEFTARPDLVLDRERQQAQGRAGSEAAGKGDDKPATHSVIGWKLDSGERPALIEAFPPRYADTVADHVTLASNVSPGTPLPPACSAEIVGQADDGSGIQALVVAIDGSTLRPDGGIFHITWSLAPPRQAVESNDLLERAGWEWLPKPCPVSLYPAKF